MDAFGGGSKVSHDASPAEPIVNTLAMPSLASHVERFAFTVLIFEITELASLASSRVRSPASR